MTVLPKANKQPVTTGDLNIVAKYNGLITDIIIGGKMMYDNLQNTNHDEQWIKEQLNTYNVSDSKEVFYAGLNSADVFYVSKKQKRKIEYYNKLS